MQPSLNRRALLALVAAPSLTAFFPALASAQERDTRSPFLRVSRLITAADNITSETADRIEGLLKAKDPNFEQRLTALIRSIGSNTDRTTALSHLSDTDLQFALEIAKPWYVGYLGSPSNTILKDDAEFATFLEAQAYQKVLQQVPRPSYPPQKAGWWGAVPEGVTAPDMPSEVTDWRFQPAAGPKEPLSPDPRWLTYVNGDYEDTDAARAARPTDA